MARRAPLHGKVGPVGVVGPFRSGAGVPLNPEGCVLKWKLARVDRGDRFEVEEGGKAGRLAPEYNIGSSVSIFLGYFSSLEACLNFRTHSAGLLCARHKINVGCAAGPVGWFGNASSPPQGLHHLFVMFKGCKSRARWSGMRSGRRINSSHSRVFHPMAGRGHVVRMKAFKRCDTEGIWEPLRHRCCEIMVGAGSVVMLAFKSDFRHIYDLLLTHSLPR